MSRGGLCFETCLPRAGGPPLELRPKQKEAGRLEVSPSCHVASLNLIFLHCKMGKKTPKVVGLCDFSGLTWEPDRGHRKSCSEDRGSGMCWGGADRAVSPWSHLRLLGPQPCGLTSFPQPSIPNSVLDSAPNLRENQKRVTYPPSPVPCVGKETEAPSGVWRSHNPGWQCQKWNQTP